MEDKGYRRLFIVRKDLHLSSGKLAVQLSHCAEEYWLQLIRKNLSHCESSSYYSSDILLDEGLVEGYLLGNITKTVCSAKNFNDLVKARDYAINCGLSQGDDFGFINDACFTELKPENNDGTCTTAFWTKPIPDEIAHSISKHYQLYKDC